MVVLQRKLMLRLLVYQYNKKATVVFDLSQEVPEGLERVGYDHPPSTRVRSGGDEMQFSWDFPYPSQRMPVLARNVAATSQPLAAQAGLRALLKGGNAVDARLAEAIALTVVEPSSNGIGGLA
jgi:hypothetical protein